MLGEGIYLIDRDEQLVELRESAYESEDVLQRLLAIHPDVIAGDQIDQNKPRRWMLIRREFGVPDGEDALDRWSLDHLFLDQDGIPTLIEVKRSTDTRIRREVVGQMLDYAANAVVYWPQERLRSEFEARCKAEDVSPDEILRTKLDRTDPDAFWQTVRTNLQAGRIRLVFVADHVPPELRRIVEFLNTQMAPAEVLALEVRRFSNPDGTLKTIVPTVIGQTSEAQQRKGYVSREKRRWTPHAFYLELLKTDPVSEPAARRLEDWASRTQGIEIYWGDGSIVGSFIPVFVCGGTRYQLFAVRTNGFVELQLGYLQNKPPLDSREKRLELVRRLNTIPGVVISEDRADRFPSFALHHLVHADAMHVFTSTWDLVLDEIKLSASKASTAAEG